MSIFLTVLSIFCDISGQNGTIFGVDPSHLGIVLMSFWHHCGIILGSFLASFRRHFEASLDHFSPVFGGVLGSLGRLFGPFRPPSIF